MAQHRIRAAPCLYHHFFGKCKASALSLCGRLCIVRMMGPAGRYVNIVMNTGVPRIAEVDIPRMDKRLLRREGSHKLIDQHRKQDDIPHEHADLARKIHRGADSRRHPQRHALLREQGSRRGN